MAFYSRRLKSAETCYTVTEQECLTVLEAVRHFQVPLLGATFHVVADHSSLRYLDKMRDENSRLARWALSLQPCIFEVIHRPGTQHANADGMVLMARRINCPGGSIMAAVSRRSRGGCHRDTLQRLTHYQPSPTHQLQKMNFKVKTRILTMKQRVQQKECDHQTEN